MPHPNSFGARATLTAAGRTYTIYRLDALKSVAGNAVDRLPFSLKILLENLLRNEDGGFVKADDIRSLAAWDVKGKVEKDLEAEGQAIDHVAGNGVQRIEPVDGVGAARCGERRASSKRVGMGHDVVWEVES